MKVSVVVPVYNTGRAVEPLLESLRAQTLPPAEWEAVFVDDGSSDGTPDLVEGLIAGDPNMRLIREAPSGWPGRPRNVGLEAARGEYVFFSDDDDVLGTEALERLVAFASEHDSDVVIPKIVGQNRGVPSITRTVVDAQDEPTLMASSLNPLKLFRRKLLLDNGIRFREGRFRLEDHLFVASAYLRAHRVSSYADYPAYYTIYHRGRAHISHQEPDWASYFRSVRACLDRVDADRPDERVRRAFRSRSLRVEALSRLRGDGYAKLASPALLHEVRTLLTDRYDPAEFAALQPIDRTLAFLLVDGREEDVGALAEWESSVEVTSHVAGAEVRADGTLQIEVRSSIAVPPPPTAGVRGDPRYPTDDELLAQVAKFARVGVELQHDRTKLRWSMRVRQLGEGRTVATCDLAEEPLDRGRWSVLTLAGEHRTRRRRPVAVEPGLHLGHGLVRVSDDQVLRLADDGRLRVFVGSVAAPPPPPPSAMRRLARRVPGAVQGVRGMRRVRRALQRSFATWRVMST